MYIRTLRISVQKAVVTDTILSLLQKKLGYETVGKLRRGSFGDVIEMKNAGTGESFAVKFIPKERLISMEVEVWPNLKHKNILRLKETIYIPEDLYLFVSPLQLTSLDRMLKQEDFRKDPDGLEKIKHWFSGVLSGLQYLHERRLCHCDLKANNVLISSDMDALICDFSFLNTTTEPVYRYGLPLIYRPPEVCYSRGFGIKTEGKPYDLWAMGMLALEVLTNRVLKEKMKGTGLVWSTDVYPVIYKRLQVKSFSKRVRCTFPVKVTDNVLEEMRNFITCFLRLDLAQRTSASVAKTHVLLGGKFFEKHPTVIWMKKAKKESIDRIVAWSVKRDFTVERFDGMVASEEDTFSRQDNNCHRFTYLQNDIDHSENPESEESIIAATCCPSSANESLSYPVKDLEPSGSPSELNEIIARSQKLLTVVNKEIQDWKEETGMISEEENVSEYAGQVFSSEEAS